MSRADRLSRLACLTSLSQTGERRFRWEEFLELDDDDLRRYQDGDAELIAAVHLFALGIIEASGGKTERVLIQKRFGGRTQNEIRAKRVGDGTGERPLAQPLQVDPQFLMMHPGGKVPIPEERTEEVP